MTPEAIEPLIENTICHEAERIVDGARHPLSGKDHQAMTPKGTSNGQS